jgi:hypothetical protein
MFIKKIKDHIKNNKVQFENVIVLNGSLVSLIKNESKNGEKKENVKSEIKLSKLLEEYDEIIDLKESYEDIFDMLGVKY